MAYFSFTGKGFVYAARILLGCLITWWTLTFFHDSKKVWALISVIVVSEPDYESVLRATISRVINTLTGCLIGLLFIYVAGLHLWALMTAVTVAVLVSTSFKKYPASWKLAPVTVIIVMLPSVVDNAPWREAMNIALMRTGEVMYGSIVALALSLVFHGLRKISEKKKTAAVSSPAAEKQDVHE